MQAKSLASLGYFVLCAMLPFFGIPLWDKAVIKPGTTGRPGRSVKNRGGNDMPETARTMIQALSHEADVPLAVKPAHGLPNIARGSAGIHGRSDWYRIFGLIHMLGSADDDGPISRIRY